MKALITAGGRGSRLFPASALVRKEFLPVRWRNGMLVPLLVKHLIDLSEAEVAEIAIVHDPADSFALRRLLTPGSYFGKWSQLSAEQRLLAAKLDVLQPMVSLIPQTVPRGLGHAVLAGANWLGGEEFLLVLGDHYMVPVVRRNCVSQMVSRSRSFRKEAVLVGLERAEFTTAYKFGCVGGAWIGPAELRVAVAIEKPRSERDRKKLATPGLGNHTVLAFFGLFRLSRTFLDCLAVRATSSDEASMELQLTPVIGDLSAQGKVVGLLLAGQRWDIGTPPDYLRALGAPISARRVRK